MGWGRLDDNLDDHPKFLALLDHEESGWGAITLWTLALAWANRNTRKPGKTPGLLPAGLPRRYLGGAGRQAAALLVEVGLWETAESGWMIHDFIDYLPSEKTRKARAEAGRKGAEARWRGKKVAESAEPGDDLDDGVDDRTEGSAASRADGNEPWPCHAGSDTGSYDVDGNEPSGSYGAAGKPDGKQMASDGSRAHARRGPTPAPVPEPEPSPSPAPPHGQGVRQQPDASRASGEGGGRGPNPRQDTAGPHGDAQVIHMGLVAEVQGIRPEWSARSIRRALEQPEVRERPAELIRAAFLLVAEDPETQHPGRLAHDGPWWNQAARQARPRPAVPDWCGRCESAARRMVELGDGRVQRCPDCHPLAGTA
jgi:hypothetical protein